MRDDGSSTVSVELTAVPGAVWQTELRSLLPNDVRASLFERGGRKYALVSFPSGQEDSARASFERALRSANEISLQAHAAAASERLARRRAAGGSLPE